LILLGLVIICAFLDDSFFTAQNLINVSRQISVVTILAFGETMLIIAGQLDLSVGTNAAMSGTFACIVYIATGSLFIALMTGIILGGIVGV
ncbi:hypothetical protein LI169_17975, partial [Desulfovibrio desulfuricans]|nr:hypothetical protein [Desulfovibrio desulfuricans]